VEEFRTLAELSTWLERAMGCTLPEGKPKEYLDLGSGLQGTANFSARFLAWTGSAEGPLSAHSADPDGY
jgi:hypothetical protein